MQGENYSRDQSLKTKQVYALLYTFNNNENKKQEGKDTRMARSKKYCEKIQTWHLMEKRIRKNTLWTTELLSACHTRGNIHMHNHTPVNPQMQTKLLPLLDQRQAGVKGCYWSVIRRHWDWISRNQFSYSATDLLAAWEVEKEEEAGEEEKKEEEEATRVEKLLKELLTWLHNSTNPNVAQRSSPPDWSFSLISQSSHRIKLPTEARQPRSKV